MEGALLPRVTILILFCHVILSNLETLRKCFFLKNMPIFSCFRGFLKVEKLGNSPFLMPQIKHPYIV